MHHKACGILASRPGIEPVFYALEGRVLTTGPPGKSFLISLDRFLGLRFLGKKDIQVFIFGITLLMSSPVGAQSLSCVRLCDPMDCRQPEFPRSEYWSGLPFSSPGDLPNPKTEPMSLVSPELAGGFFTNSATWEAPISPKC